MPGKLLSNPCNMHAHMQRTCMDIYKLVNYINTCIYYILSSTYVLHTCICMALLALSHMHMHGIARSLSHACAHTCTHIYTYMCLLYIMMQKLTHTHTHTRIHTRQSTRLAFPSNICITNMVVPKPVS